MTDMTRVDIERLAAWMFVAGVIFGFFVGIGFIVWVW
jgi:hypothetical protein